MADFIQTMTAERDKAERAKRTQAARAANLPGVTGEMTDTPDTLRMKLSGLIAEGLMKLGMSGRGAYDLGGRTTTVAEAGTPFGMVTGMEDLARAENPREAAMAAIGLVPGVGPEARVAKNVGREALAEAKAGIRAYHGSPHSFEQFDINKIGTGEGAQAYGHGLYFAENEGVAKSYRDQLAADYFDTADGRKWSPDALEHLNVRSLLNRTGDIDAALQKANELLPTANAQTLPMLQGDIARLEDLKARGGIKRGSSGSMYEVNIAADPAHFLDWDKPLSEQSGPVRDALENKMRHSNNSRRYMQENPSAGDFYNNLNPDQRVMAQSLNEAGIPGIKYLDQGSRNPTAVLLDGKPIASNDYVAQAAADALGTYGTHEAAIKALGAHPGYKNTNRDAAALLQSGRLTTPPPSRNYVVFDPKIINIVKKYGIAGALGAGLISAEMASQMQEQGLGGT